MTMKGIIRGIMTRFGRTEQTVARPVRGPSDLVVMIDGTMSSLQPGGETNLGLAYKLLKEGAQGHTSFRYEGGVQWKTWSNTLEIIEGRGINRQIRRMYGFLASRYRPGDRIFLFGYSRGAYAVRSLAGMIDAVGLLKAEHATERNILLAYRHYERGHAGLAQRAFVRRYCHPDVPIEMVGVWDTVKALGLRAPFLHHRVERRHAFHNHRLGRTVRHGFHALALDETRRAFAPVLWETPHDWDGKVEQMWFPGSHGDVGGQIGGRMAARPLANLSLVWMLEHAETCGLTLPPGWRARLPVDPSAPSIGTWHGWAKIFLARGRRIVGRDASERIHPSAFRGRPPRWSAARHATERQPGGAEPTG